MNAKCNSNSVIQNVGNLALFPGTIAFRCIIVEILIQKLDKFTTK